MRKLMWETVARDARKPANSTTQQGKLKLGQVETRKALDRVDVYSRYNRRAVKSGMKGTGLVLIKLSIAM